MAIEVKQPGEFDGVNHYYARTLNAQIHPLIPSFMRMNLQQIVRRYCHLHPHTREEALRELLQTAPKFLYWSGSDIFNASTDNGVKKKYVIETNSCPSGQKSFPTTDREAGGYHNLLKNTFIPRMKKALKKYPDGIVAVIYDKNKMETSGYAQTLADLLNKPVYLIPDFLGQERFLTVEDSRLFANIDGRVVPISCAFRYVTQKPWNRLPVTLKTPIFNPTIACLAGGRNKTVAAKAYELFNSQHRRDGLEISVPESYTNVNKEEIPLIVHKLGGKAVIKIPYLNAGQGVYTVVNQDELNRFMEQDHPYKEFIVQQLIGNYSWSSLTPQGRIFNIGTVPDKKGNIYVFDLRMMISWQHTEYRPVAMYARRAAEPMDTSLEGKDSWSVLGTNLSIKLDNHQWDTDPKRLLMMDQKDFLKLGLGLDDLIEAFIQAVMASSAVDQMAQLLRTKKGSFRKKLFQSMNDDPVLLEEIQI